MGDELTSVIFASSPPFWYQHPDSAWGGGLPCALDSRCSRWLTPLAGTGVLMERHKLFRARIHSLQQQTDPTGLCTGCCYRNRVLPWVLTLLSPARQLSL